MMLSPDGITLSNIGYPYGVYDKYPMFERNNFLGAKPLKNYVLWNQGTASFYAPLYFLPYSFFPDKLASCPNQKKLQS